jgi:hypothetical protein
MEKRRRRGTRPLGQAAGFVGGCAPLNGETATDFHGHANKAKTDGKSLIGDER